MSPILFAIYINGLAEEIKKAKLGAQILIRRDPKVGILMFADDIALLADEKEKLQELMDLTFEYSCKWRFSFNYDKCAVVIFNEIDTSPYLYGNCTEHCTCGYHWRLGDKLIKQQESYKYLGIELDQKLSFKEFKERILSKARKCMSAMWGMGMADGSLSVKATINLYETCVRSIVEYGAQIWGVGTWDEAELLQREMGRRILRCPFTTTREAIQGELGWWTLQTRRDFIRLKYWIKLTLMKDSRLVRQIYKLSKEEYLRKGTKNWAYDIHHTIIKYGLNELWKNEDLVRHPVARDRNRVEELQAFWNTELAKRIQQVEQEAWKKLVLSRPKLRTYCTIKTQLRIEPYLIEEHEKLGRYWLTRIRSGTNPLRIDTGRQKRPKKESIEARVCRECSSGEIEDEKHFVLRCSKYQDLRGEMIQLLPPIVRIGSDEERWVYIMGERKKTKAEDKVLKRFLKRAMRRRKQT